MSPLPLDLLSDTAEVANDGVLHVGGCNTLDLAKEFGTPLFVYDEEHMRARCRDAVAAFGSMATYASKAFTCKAMVKLAYEEGMNIDVTTGGEIHVCLAADIPASRLVFHGNNKSLDELIMALKAGVGKIVIDSFDEIDRLEKLHSAGYEIPEVMVRISPGIKAETHKYLTTGHDDSKFGFIVASGDAHKAVEKVRASTALNLVGIHAHIGSQVFRIDSFAQALEQVAEFAAPYELPKLVIGGGLGVAYVEGETHHSVAQWCQILKDKAAEIGITSAIGIEPGRSIVAAAALTLYTTGTIKKVPNIGNYVAVDGGFGDNPRPMLYDSGYEAFTPAQTLADRTFSTRLVGKHCESSDVLVENAKLPADIAVGDIVATPVTGGYGFCMGSNYNRVRRPAVVFCSKGNARLVVRRETYDDLLLTDMD